VRNTIHGRSGGVVVREDGVGQCYQGLLNHTCTPPKLTPRNPPFTASGPEGHPVQDAKWGNSILNRPSLRLASEPLKPDSFLRHIPFEAK